VIPARRFAGGSNIIMLGQGTAPSGGGSVVVPSAPQGVSAVAGNAQATVVFNAPSSNGGAAITGYTVTSSPAGGTDADGGTTALTHTITGLSNGVVYTFTVTADNSAGTGQVSAASNPVTPHVTTVTSSPWTSVAPAHTGWTPV
jgi:hypothetical protein